MRNWILGIAMMCLAVVAAQKTYETFGPAKPDEEGIIWAAIAPKKISILDYAKKEEWVIGVSDQWAGSSTDFDSIIKSKLSDLENDPWEESKEAQIKMVQALRNVIAKIPEMEVRSTPPQLSLSKVTLPPGHVWVKGKAGRPLTTPGGVYIDSTISFEYPVFSKDRNYAFLSYRLSYEHVSFYWCCLEKIGNRWQVIAENSVHLV